MDAKVVSLMTKDVCTLASSDTIEEVERVLANRGLTGAPVTDGGRLVGVVSRSDLVRQVAVERAIDGYVSDWYRMDPMVASDTDSAEPGIVVDDELGDRPVSEVMSAPAISIGADKTAGAAAALMLKHRVHRLIVTEGDAVVGILTTMDLLRTMVPRTDAP